MGWSVVGAGVRLAFPTKAQLALGFAVCKTWSPQQLLSWALTQVPALLLYFRVTLSKCLLWPLFFH